MAPFIENLAAHGGAPADLFTYVAHPICLAISFCHCKNTGCHEHRVPPALMKKHQRRGHPCVDRYYTLDIQPMQRVLREAGAATLGLKRALHICRGHFKDYRDGGGLFGRYRGLYWWDMHSRGTAARGTIRKDYAITPPARDGDSTP
jgi:hypothetical protein